MQDSPAADTILDGVAAFLRDEIMPDYEGRKAYQVRIAASVCGIIARELRLELGMLEEEHEALSALLDRPAGTPGATDLRPAVASMLAELSGKIRSGEIEQDRPDVRAAAMQQAVDKLRVINPQYLD